MLILFVTVFHDFGCSFNIIYLVFGCQVGRKCKFFQWRDDEIYKRGKVLIPEQRRPILTLEADIPGYRKREKRLLICLGLSLVISGMLLRLMILLVGEIGGGKMGH